MSLGYLLHHTKRSWYVPDVNVWGTAGWADFDYLVLEEINSVRSIFYNSVSLDEGAQEIAYEQLVDFRGNKLPAEISNPKVFIKPRSAEPVFIVGSESNRQFSIASASQSSAPVLVDLYVVELN